MGERPRCASASKRVFAAAAAIAGLMLLAGCDGSGSGAGSGASGAESAAEISYRRFCYSCHASGAGGAPRLGDAQAWAPRVAQGWPVLMTHTIEGIRGMPARGLCRQCSDEDLADLVSWMLEQSGGMPVDAPVDDPVDAAVDATVSETVPEETLSGLEQTP